MKKVIALIRTSTDRQDREEQKKEVIEVILSDGYYVEEIEVIGDEEGASAIKIDEQYMKNLNKVYSLIEDGSIECVYAWAVDRIGRTRTHLTNFREFLVNHKVQLVIKNPSLRLLDANGEEDGGVGLAFSLFCEMAVQEMKQKKARFKRGKKRNAEAGKFNGGTVPYGYELNEDGYYVPFKEEADNVKLAFELMASDRYSVATLTKELRERGVMVNDRLITYQFTVALLKNTCYIGFRNKYAFNKKYPRLVSDELFNRVKEVMANNNSSKGKTSQHYNFASLLIKCPVCGRNYIASHGKKYVCSAHNSPSIRRTMGQKECDNNLTIDLSHLDGLLWSIATGLHYEYIKGLDAQQKIDIEEQIRVLELKKNESAKLFAEIEERFERLETVYISGRSRMTKAKYETLLSAIEADEKALSNEVAGYDEEINRLNNLLTGSDDKDEIRKWFDDNYILTQLKAEENEKMMYDVVHKYITSVTLEPVTTPADLKTSGDFFKDGKKVNNRYYKVNNREAVLVTITCYDGTKRQFFFLRNFRNCVNKFIFIEDSVAYPYSYEPILRADGGYATTESIVYMKKLIDEIGNCLRMDWNNRNKMFNMLVFGMLPKYGARYTGNYDEAGEEAFKDVKQAYHKLHCLHNLVWVVNAFNAASKYYEVDDVKQSDIMSKTPL